MNQDSPSKDGGPKVLYSSYPLGEEIANSVAHGIGAAFGIVATTILLTISVQKGDALKIISFTIYGLSLIGLYLSSTFYHSIPNPRAKYIFKILDHCFIYVLIAGTYTPFTLITLKNHSGNVLFGLIWSLALVGILFKIYSRQKSKKVSALIYLVMSWTAGVAGYELLNLLDKGCIWFIVGGGLAYTLGTIFYVNKKLAYSHAIWHVFVLMGSVLHFFAIFFYLL